MAAYHPMPSSRRRPSWGFFVALHAFAGTATSRTPFIAAAAENDDDIVLGRDLMEWIRKNGGYVNLKQEYRRADPSDPTSSATMYATEELQKGELLLSVPWDLIVKPSEAEWDETEFGALTCPTVRQVMKEMKLGELSDVAPYAKYLSNKKEGVLPATWSHAGKSLLETILGTEPRRLPPDDVDLFLEEWVDECEGGTDPSGIRAAMLCLQLAEDHLMIPVFDMYAHRNGRWYNTKCHEVSGVRFDVSANRAIEKGEPLHNSMNMCNKCGGRSDDYGSGDLLRDYGIVESMPQRWIIDDDAFGSVKFDLDEVETDDDGGKELKVSWVKRKVPKPEEIDALRVELDRIRSIAKNKDDYLVNGFPPNEWDTIWKYHSALETALVHAIEAVRGKGSASGPEEATLTAGTDEL